MICFTKYFVCRLPGVGCWFDRFMHCLSYFDCAAGRLLCLGAKFQESSLLGFIHPNRNILRIYKYVLVCTSSCSLFWVLARMPILLISSYCPLPHRTLNLLQIEETPLAGRRHALVTGGPSRYVSINNDGGGGMSISNSDKDPVGEGGEEAQGLLASGGGYSRRVGSGKASAASVAPACAGDLVPIIGSRRKAAVGAGRAKRRGSLNKGAEEGARRNAATMAASGSRSSRSSSSRSNGRKPGLSHSKPPLKVSRSLFIEIENKASEPPRKATPTRGRVASRRQHDGVVVHGRTSATGEDADDEHDSDGESGVTVEFEGGKRTGVREQVNY